MVGMQEVDNGKAAGYTTPMAAIQMLPDHMSFSQAMMWLKCQRQWFFRYVQGLRVPPPGALVVGTATHRAIRHLNLTKATTARPAPKAEVLDIYGEVFDEEARDAVWDEETPGEAKDRGYRGLALYWDLAAESVQPAGPEAVEEHIAVPLPGAGVDLVGFVDCRTDQGEIFDYKTTTKKPPEELPDDLKLQLGIYRFGYQKNGVKIKDCCVWHIVAGKKASVILSPVPPATEPETRRILRTLTIARVGMETACTTGLFHPALPGQWYCSPKWCGYWDACQAYDW